MYVPNSTCATLAGACPDAVALRRYRQVPPVSSSLRTQTEAQDLSTDDRRTSSEAL